MAPLRVISVRRKKQFPSVSLVQNKPAGVMNETPAPPPPGSGLRGNPSPRLPHVDMKRLGDVDLEAPRPGTVGDVHEPHTQQLVVVVAGPVEDHAGAWRRGDVTLWVGCPLRHGGVRVHVCSPVTTRPNRNIRQAKLAAANSFPEGRWRLLTFPLANSL